MNTPEWKNTSILGGSSMSSPIPCHGQAAVKVRIPAGFEGSTISLYESQDSKGETRSKLHGVSKDVAAGETTLLDPAELVGVDFLWIEAPQTQSTTRQLAVAFIQTK